MNDPKQQIEIDPFPADIYAYPDSIYIDSNVRGCLTVTRAIKKIVYGSGKRVVEVLVNSKEDKDGTV